MIRNKYSNIGIMLLIIVSVISCDKLKFGDDFLEKPPAGDLTIDDIYSDATYARRALWAAYKTLPTGFVFSHRTKLNWDVLECLTDLNNSIMPWGSNASELYYPGLVTAVMESTYRGTKYSYLGRAGEMNWQGIRQAYLFIENVDRVPDMQEQEKTLLKAEAKVIIAIHYSDMFRHFGGLPWIDHAYIPTEAVEKERETALQTMNNIVDLLDEAAAVLPWTVDDPLYWDGRMTKAAAMGLKARILLFGASPLFNSASPYLQGDASDLHLCWYGSYMPELWQRALKAHEDFFDEMNRSGGYQLVNEGANYRSLWRKAYLERNNGECIVSVREILYANVYDIDSYAWALCSNQWGSGNPTQEWVNMFPMVNGKSIFEPDSEYDPDFPYANRDPRMYESIVTNGDAYATTNRAETFVGGVCHAQPGWESGYRVRKFVLDGGSPPLYETPELQSIPHHYPYLRLPELYYGYAEAICHTGGNMNQAYDLVNAMRTRVGVGGIKPGLTGEDFIEAVLTERSLELAFEEVRWFDMVRYKREDIFTKPLHRVEITRKDMSESPPVSFNYNYIPYEPRYWARNFSPKWYLSAFPSDEINKRYGLVQNPGW